MIVARGWELNTQIKARAVRLVLDEGKSVVPSPAISIWPGVGAETLVDQNRAYPYRVVRRSGTKRTVNDLNQIVRGSIALRACESRPSTNIDLEEKYAEPPHLVL